MITSVAVVVPAHDEATTLPACLASLRRAAQRSPVPVRLIVVADACADATVSVARRGGAGVVEIGARNVGAARAAGLRQAIATAGTEPARIWLATTDADSTVPPDWLSAHLRYAALGWEAVLGTVKVADWSARPPHLPDVYLRRYGVWNGEHPHVHGANLGFGAAAYLAAGGFPPLRTSEDHALVHAIVACGRRVLRTSDLPVVTSARRTARAPRGFGHLLDILAGPPSPLPAR